MARPLKPIDGEQVYELAKDGCTQDDIAEKFGCDQATISRRFASEYKLGLGECKTSLRAKQVERALNGSDKMLIHLGMALLGQTKRVDVTSGGRTVYVDRASNPRDTNLTDLIGANGDGNGVAS